MKPTVPCALAPLDPKHPARNTPLAGFRFRIWYLDDGEPNDPFPRNHCWKFTTKKGKEVMPSWPIAKLTYNDLGEVWTDNVCWILPATSADSCTPETPQLESKEPQHRCQ